MLEHAALPCGCWWCRSAGVPVLVDGAHSVGSLADLQVPQLGCDFFVSTLHKWLCTPKVPLSEQQVVAGVRAARASVRLLCNELQQR